MRKFKTVILFLLFLSVLPVYSTERHISNASDFLSLSGLRLDNETIYIDSDIDLGNSVFNTIPYFYGEINGQGHAIKGLNISSSSRTNVGLIDTLKSGSYIHDIRIDGKIENTRNANATRASLICNVLKNTSKTTIIENVDNRVSIYITGSKVKVAGFVTYTSGSGQLYIRNCQYRDTIVVSPYKLETSGYGGYYAFDHCAGIIGQILTNDMVENCLYAGHIKINVPYRSDTIANTSEHYNYDGNIGGIAGYAGKAQSSGTGESGIKNCLSTGTFDLNGNSFKNSGAVAGIVSSKATTDNNYWVNDTINKGCSSRTEKGTSSAADNSTQTTQEEVDNGTVYEELNNNNSSGTWGQYPTTDYEKDNNNYTISYFNFNDNGDVTSMPENASSITITNCVYKRAAKYVKGMMSVCLPFEVSKSDGSLPDGTIYEFSHADKDANNIVTAVYFREKADQNTIEAGEAVFFKPAIENVEWNIVAHNVTLVTEPIHKSVGVNGTFNTITLGTGYFKLNSAGDNLSCTIATSKCYPFRAYVSLPDDYIVQTGSSSAPMRVVFSGTTEDTPTVINNIENQPYTKFMRNGRIYIRVNGVVYDIHGNKTNIE